MFIYFTVYSPLQLHAKDISTQSLYKTSIFKGRNMHVLSLDYMCVYIYMYVPIGINKCN